MDGGQESYEVLLGNAEVPPGEQEALHTVTVEDLITLKEIDRLKRKQKKIRDEEKDYLVDEEER